MTHTPLAVQQQALLKALWLARDDEAFAWLASTATIDTLPTSLRGIAAYRTNANALAARALQGAFPVVAQLVGDANFDALARTLWRSDPPVRGDVAQWGGHLPAHIEAMPQLCRDAPYLADVARVEWQLHCAATAADSAVDMQSLALLAECDPGDIGLHLAPGTAIVTSTHPVVSVIQAHGGQASAMALAAQHLRDHVAQTAVVWRSGLAPQLRAAAPGEADFLRALQEKRSLGDSLDAAAGLDFPSWLAVAVQSGLLTGAAPLLNDSMENT
ncbi:putative DNA-binding domain-containing protein [Caenimonas koreensis]|uniref:HvfC/BufC family peptide modification chaperone n=1 Tax=Caenimonas koreensis TaxID=367474 RepID=UPI00378300BB